MDRSQPERGVADGRAPIIAEYALLLQKLVRLNRELESVKTDAQRAGDAAWTAVVDAFEPLFADDQTPRQVVHCIAKVFSSQEIERIDLTGQRIDEIEHLRFETIAERATDNPDEQGRVAETWTPVVLRGGRIIRPGQVIVFSETESDDTS